METGQVKFLKTEFTFVIDKAEGHSFSRYSFSANAKEPIIGAFKRDKRSGVMTDFDGSMNFELYGSDKMELCYTHAVSATGKSAVAA
jgi:hypothetical protein